jgi:hypothetical protein
LAIGGKVLVVGGYGMIGTSLVRQLRAAGHGVELILAGRNPDQGRNLAAEIGNATCAAVDVDAIADTIKPLGQVDLIVAAITDPGDRLLAAALRSGSAYLSVSRTTDSVAPGLFAVRHANPPRPIAILGHWQAGVLMLLAKSGCAQFSSVDEIAMAALYDPDDPIGPMVAAESGGYVGTALVRDNYLWKSIAARENPRHVARDSSYSFEAHPMGVLDVVSLAAITKASSIRFDVGVAVSTGSAAGRAPSHDLFVDIRGRRRDGATGRLRLRLVGRQGQASLTAFGMLLATEAILGLGGRPAVEGGLHFPETLVDDQTFQRRIRAQDFEIEELWEPV